MKRFSIFLLFFASFFGACNREDEAPAGYVYLYINTELITHQLQYPGSFNFFEYNHDGTPAGINGVGIYRANNETFYAYECTCPIDEQPLDIGDMTLKCTSCGSLFSILNGMGYEGKAEGRYLRQYKTYFDGRFLTVSN